MMVLVVVGKRLVGICLSFRVVLLVPSRSGSDWPYHWRQALPQLFQERGKYTSWSRERGSSSALWVWLCDPPQSRWSSQARLFARWLLNDIQFSILSCPLAVEAVLLQRLDPIPESTLRRGWGLRSGSCWKVVLHALDLSPTPSMATPHLLFALPHWSKGSSTTKDGLVLTSTGLWNHALVYTKALAGLLLGPSHLMRSGSVSFPWNQTSLRGRKASSSFRKLHANTPSQAIRRADVIMRLAPKGINKGVTNPYRIKTSPTHSSLLP